MEESYKLNDGHIIEAVDRVHLMQTFLESVLHEHPLIDAVADFSDKVRIARDALGELYQEIAEHDCLETILSKYQITPPYEV